MREYDLEEILAEYAEENAETAQPEEAAVLPEKENATAAGYPYGDENPAEENALPEESGEAVDNTDDAETAWETAEAPLEEPDAQLTRVFKAPKPEKTGGGQARGDADSPQTAVTEMTEQKEAKKERRKKPKKESFGRKLGFGLLSLIFMAVSLGVLAWVLQNVHPDTGRTTESTRSLGNTNLVSRLDTGLNNAKANALSDIAYIPKHYTIPEGETVAPRPQETNFGSVTPENAANVMDVIQHMQPYETVDHYRCTA